MHELSLCQSAVELIEKKIVGQSVTQVTAVWFEAGAAANIEEDALRFAFDCASVGTVLEGATVHFSILPAFAWCWDCEAKVEVRSYGDVCPHCQSVHLSLDNNDTDKEFKVKQIEVS